MNGLIFKLTSEQEVGLDLIFVFKLPSYIFIKLKIFECVTKDDNTLLFSREEMYKRF